MASTGGDRRTVSARASAPRGSARRWTKDRQLAFAATLAVCLNVTRAAEAVGMSPRSAYLLKQRDAGFARAWAEALDLGYSDLEFEMLRQSVQGSERTETVRDGGSGDIKQIKVVRSFPHGLAIRLLQAHREEVVAFRLAQMERQDDEAVMARVQAHMDLVRERLLEPAVVERIGEAERADDR